MTQQKLDYAAQEYARSKNLFASKHKEGFQNVNNFSEWYKNQLKAQDFCCYYCSTSIFDIQKLITDQKLKTRKTGYGTRGRNLEIDKKVNDRGYTTDNCVLACYYCNNDKSYIFDDEFYKMHFGPARKAYFDLLLKS